MKYAVLSMDIEDWYHLDYFDARKCNTDYSIQYVKNNSL